MASSSSPAAVRASACMDYGCDDLKYAMLNSDSLELSMADSASANHRPIRQRVQHESPNLRSSRTLVIVCSRIWQELCSKGSLGQFGSLSGCEAAGEAPRCWYC
uniref:Uncharacterized protein n=1 Tax=Hyaloperonospora arabidopsidis (strain Emoy2) TaxID=559515 RepID=M4BDV3_HYAAE